MHSYMQVSRMLLIWIWGHGVDKTEHYHPKIRNFKSINWLKNSLKTA